MPFFKKSGHKKDDDKTNQLLREKIAAGEPLTKDECRFIEEAKKKAFRLHLERRAKFKEATKYDHWKWIAFYIMFKGGGCQYNLAFCHL